MKIFNASHRVLSLGATHCTVPMRDSASFMFWVCFLAVKKTRETLMHGQVTPKYTFFLWLVVL